MAMKSNCSTGVAVRTGRAPTPALLPASLLPASPPAAPLPMLLAWRPNVAAHAAAALSSRRFDVPQMYSLVRCACAELLLIFTMSPFLSFLDDSGLAVGRLLKLSRPNPRS